MSARTENSASLVEDYANSPVPDSRLVSGWRVALIVTGFNIALPGFLNGAQIAAALGLSQALLVALLAGAVLCAMSCLTSFVAVRTRLTTYLLVQRSFGTAGASLVNVIMALAHFGWFGVNASFFGAAMVAAVHELFGITLPFDVVVLVGGMLMALTTIFGFRALDKLALIAVPVLGVILAIVLFKAIGAYGVVSGPRPAPPVPMTFGVALTSLVGSNMMTVATMPDLSRYIRTTRQALVGMLLSFPLATPLLLFVAAVPSLATGETDIMRIIVGFGLGVPALLVLILSTWTINAANLYSASLSLTATFPRIAQWKFTLLAGLCGSLLAVAGIIDSFVSFLIILGVTVPPIAAIYLLDAFAGRATRARVSWPAVATWVASSGIALAAHSGWFTLTTVPALDAALIATLIYGAWMRLRTTG